jgi:hypothetical protein
MKELAMLIAILKKISPAYFAVTGVVFIVVVPAIIIAAFPHDGLAKSMTRTELPVGGTAVLFTLAGAFWLARPLGKQSGHWPDPKAAHKELCRRAGQVSMLAALAIYFTAGLGVTVAYQGWGACEGYLREHILDGFGCVAFFAAGWSQLERHPRQVPAAEQLSKATIMLSAATAGIAAAAAFVAGGVHLDIGLIAVVGFGYGCFIWGCITSRFGLLEFALKKRGGRGAINQEYGRAVQEYLPRSATLVSGGTMAKPAPPAAAAVDTAG